MLPTQCARLGAPQLVTRRSAKPQLAVKIRTRVRYTHRVQNCPCVAPILALLPPRSLLLNRIRLVFASNGYRQANGGSNCDASAGPAIRTVVTALVVPVTDPS